MCEYCHNIAGTRETHGHHPRCPDAPIIVVAQQCKKCGDELDEFWDQVYHGYCENCIKEKFTVELALKFIKRGYDTMAEFFEWESDGELTYRKHPLREQFNIILCRDLSARISSLSSPIYSYTEQILRDFCLDDLESWGDFLKEEDAL